MSRELRMVRLKLSDVSGSSGSPGSSRAGWLDDWRKRSIAAWASAGVTIPRDTYEQWAGLPHIPVSQMVPGDLIIYDGEGHVGMYVGDGYIIDAPHTGADVERIPYSTPWYVDSEDGVLQP